VRSVPDPYYGGPDGFERVLDMIEQATENILDYLMTGSFKGMERL
jgi:protein-tyrosine phosphatase